MRQGFPRDARAFSTTIPGRVMVFTGLSLGVLLFSLIGRWFVGTSMGLASPIFPAAGLSLAAALVFDPATACLAAFSGEALAEWLSGAGEWEAVFAGLRPVLETFAGWVAVTRIARADPQLPNLSALLRYLPAACLAGPLVRGLETLLSSPPGTPTPGLAFGAWQASALGTLIFGPFFLFLFQRQDLRPGSRQETYELLLAHAVLAGILYWLMTDRALPDAVFVFLLVVCLVLAIAVAARMGLRPTALFLAAFVFLVPAFVAMFPEKTGGLRALHYAKSELGLSGAVGFLAALGCLLLGAFRDELTAIRTRFTLAMASADLCFWDWSDKHWRFYTPDWQAKFGLPGTKHVPESAWFGNIEASDRARVENSFEAFHRDGGTERAGAVWHCDYRARDAGGRVRWISSRAAILRRGPDDFAAVVAGIHRDMTEEREAENHRLAALRTEADLRELRSQLNPHFLLNALNSISALLGRRNDLAREMIVALGRFLRRILSGGGGRLVPLEDELDLVRDYLGIEKIRFEERLRWTIECAPEAARVPVPPMLVLTLAENALKHGICRLERGGRLEISAGIAGGNLEISVVNDGPLRMEKTGLGLENCRRRIELASGGRGSLHLMEEPGPRVRAAVVLPPPNHSQP